MKFPAYAKPLFQPKRYKVLRGGRGSAKSYTVADILLTKGVQSKRRILCAREFQNSIADSVHKLLQERIDSHGFTRHYNVLRDRIIGTNGTEFIFKGVAHNTNSIKSMQGITDLWLEEAHTVSQTSWDILIPTIRQEGSEIYVTYNPDTEDDPTHKMFSKERDDAIIIDANWMDNPWFPDVLKKEKDYLYEVNPDLAAHVWGGECRSNSDSQIFKNKWVVMPFEKSDKFYGPYFGADFGFSVDPSTLIKMYIDIESRELLIRNESWGVGVELDDMKDFYNRVPGVGHNRIRADKARPETIAFLKRKGFNIQGADKWEGSVEDGIEFMRSFKRIVIHPECPKTAEEFKKYSYKIDKLTGDVTTDIIDKWNHCIDSIRYGLQPIIQASNNSILNVL